MTKVRAIKSAITVLRDRINELPLSSEGATLGGTFIFDMLAASKITR
jgi:hypothetical protein